MSDDQYDTVYPLLYCDQGFKAWTAIPIRRSTNTMTTATSTAIIPRAPLDDDNPDGYMESDRDFVMKNIDAAVELLERELEKQQQPAT